MRESNSVTLRTMIRDDLPQAYELSQSVGWGHRLEDWLMLFDLGKGFVAVNSTGAVQGVALWWPYGARFATLGMVIVSPNLQRSGIGRRLMEAILSAADGRRILLNATAEGLRLYRSLGFAVTGEVCTYYGSLSRNASRSNVEGQIREVREHDWPAMRTLDRQASSMDRTELLAALGSESRGWVAESSAQLSGFVLCRKFGKATLLGPLVADTEVNALALLSTAALAIGGTLRVDIPEDARDLALWLQSAGLSEVGRVSTMWRPGAPSADSRVRIFGLAAQALG